MKEYIKNIIQNIIIHIQFIRNYKIINTCDYNNCHILLEELNHTLENEPFDEDHIYNQLNIIISKYGINNLNDLIQIYYGKNYDRLEMDKEDKDIYSIVCKYFRPINYHNTTKNTKIMIRGESSKDFNKIVFSTKKISRRETIKNKSIIFSDIYTKNNNFYLKTFGIQLSFLCKKTKNRICINGILDNIVLNFLDEPYINNKKTITYHKLNGNKQDEILFLDYFYTLHLKDILLFNTDTLYFNFKLYKLNIKNIKEKDLSHTINDFMGKELFLKRKILIELLIDNKDNENMILSYLLYDLLSSENITDTQEQIMLYDSFPYIIKQKFKDAIQSNIEYTNALSNFDIQKIPLEQRICMMKVQDDVKEKAMVKLKEIKTKTDDSASKARQYLDGLLKIPFGIYKKEKILTITDTIKYNFRNMIKTEDFIQLYPEYIEKKNISNIEIINTLKNIKNKIYNHSNYYGNLTKYTKQLLIDNIKLINTYITNNSIQDFIHFNIEKNYNKKYIINHIVLFLEYCKNNNIPIENIIHIKIIINDIFYSIKKDIIILEDHFKYINQYIFNIRNILDKAVYGHNKAKIQLERIIGQWINGENRGYCFGFEGPPGVGKTSLAKNGLSECLIDEDGFSRPFSLIQIGGDNNGSSLQGHNYTYVGSNWGCILQILMDKKVMNPIILIDEVDKISKTENGKELIGILTHILDPTQNKYFQDKYFSNIDIDLSKVLFILSYNDPDLIDKILLDRIHRIKFNNLDTEEKIIISQKFLLPEIYQMMGLENSIEIDTETIRYIILEYTCEAGVRKLKELYFEIIGEINLKILKNELYENLPIKLSINDICNIYLKDKYKINTKPITKHNKIGVISGLYASNTGGGIVPIQSKFFPSSIFLDLKLSGSLGDVMTESMKVALTLAWNLCSSDIKNNIQNDKNNGIHIHCPEGSIPKEGSSAGTAITIALYSLFNNKEIPYDIAITGEIDLDGNITEIGGLELKIIGGIKSGIKKIIYPLDNQKDFELFIKKYNNNEIIQDILFYKVKHIQEVINIIFL